MPVYRVRMNSGSPRLRHSSSSHLKASELACSTSADEPSGPFVDVCHSKVVLNALNNLRLQDDFCDVVLQVGGRTFPCHKVVLAANSPYFRAMFSDDMLESRQASVTLQELDELAMELMIHYFYTSTINIDDSNVQEILPLSCILQVKPVQDACSEFLRRQLTPDNCLGIATFADTHSCQRLLSESELFARRNFIDVVQNEEFMLISPQQLSRLISDDVLNVQSEERVFEAVMAWIQHDVDARKEYANEILSNVRFPLLSPEYLMDRVATEEIIRTTRVGSDLLIEAAKCLLLPRRKSQVTNHRVTPRRPPSVQQVLYAVGGMSRREATKSGEKYDPREGKWTPIGKMNICRWGAAIGNLGHHLFICGGSDDASRLNTTERYDPVTNVWIPAVAMSTSRNGVGVASANGKIYAIGGFDGSMPLDTGEYFDPKTNKWTEIARMNQCRFGVGCCALNDMIYAIGGSDGTNLKSVERYDPETDTWTHVAPMNIARKQVGVATLGGYIYAVGGCDHGTRYNSVERYDFMTDKWTEVCPMKTARSGCGVGVLDAFLYAVGGYDGNEYLKTVERYDPLNNKWQSAPPMEQIRDCVAVCVATTKLTCSATKRVRNKNNAAAQSSSVQSHGSNL